MMADLEPRAAPDPNKYNDAHAPLVGPRAYIYSVFRWIIHQFFRIYFRAEVRGGHNIPAEGGFILAPGGHRSNLDTPLVSAVTSRHLRYMGKASLWEASAFGGYFLSSMGGFPVRRGSADREALRICGDVLRNGEPLVMFPEGNRREGPDIVEVHDGPSHVALKAGVPVVPVGLGGMARAMPVGYKGIKPKKVVMIVGEPLYPPVSETGRVSRKATRAFSEQLRVRLQELFDEAQAAAGVTDHFPTGEAEPS